MPRLKDKPSTLTMADLFLVAFVCMKIAGEIDWSWWAVLIPLWATMLVHLVAAVYADIKED